MTRKSDGPAGGSGRVTYRELRNTPGRVWERLANREVLTLVAEGEAKALVVPVENGDVAGTYEALVRGQALLAASRMRRQTRSAGKGPLTLEQINSVIRATRASRRTAGSARARRK